jgi:hypothetical protein
MNIAFINYEIRRIPLELFADYSSFHFRVDEDNEEIGKHLDDNK